MSPESGFPRPPKTPKPVPLIIPENDTPESSKRYTSPRPSRGRRIDLSHGLSPYSKERAPLLEAIARDGISKLKLDAVSKKGHSLSGRPVARKLDMDSGAKSRQDEGLVVTTSRRSSTDQERAIAQVSMEAHSLISGTGYAFSSSKHKYGGLSSQSSVEDAQRPVMQSAKDHEWVRAGGMATKPDSIVTAVATGDQVTGKLGRARKNEGSGSVEFRAGSDFRKIYKVERGERIEKTLNAGDVIDSGNNKFRQVTVTTHLAGEGSCLVAACNTGRSDALIAPAMQEMGKDKHV